MLLSRLTRTHCPSTCQSVQNPWCRNQTAVAVLSGRDRLWVVPCKLSGWSSVVSAMCCGCCRCRTLALQPCLCVVGVSEIWAIHSLPAYGHPCTVDVLPGPMGVMTHPRVIRAPTLCSTCMFCCARLSPWSGHVLSVHKC